MIKKIRIYKKEKTDGEVIMDLYIQKDNPSETEKIISMYVEKYYSNVFIHRLNPIRNNRDKLIVFDFINSDIKKLPILIDNDKIIEENIIEYLQQNN